jgi:hypothetical protein
MIERVGWYIAWLIFLIACSGNTGFKFVEFLVRWQRWTERYIVNPLLPYNWFWLIAFVIPFLVVAILAVIALFKIANQCKRYNDHRPMLYPDEDLYDKAARP